MTTKEKQATIMDFYDTAGQAQRYIEAGLDTWLEGDGDDVFDRALLDTIELVIRLLRFRLDNTG